MMLSETQPIPVVGGLRWKHVASRALKSFQHSAFDSLNQRRRIGLAEELGKDLKVVGLTSKECDVRIRLRRDVPNVLEVLFD
jgi:hypothetical protein